MHKKKPVWLNKRLPAGPAFEKTRRLIDRGALNTVCQAAQCPNIWECFDQQRATFLILGRQCTRNCLFCAVEAGVPVAPDPHEPQRVATLVSEMGLHYVTITSVTRDDLPDGGAAHFAQTIDALRKTAPHTRVEVLIPDFQGNPKALQKVITASPDVLNHNMETVPRLYPQVRPQADYQRSLTLLAHVREMAPHMPTKSGLMLGLGETDAEIEQTLQDLIAADCQILTLGQYLQPSRKHLRVEAYIPPERFDHWRKKALALGFQAAACGSFVRSSYQAEQLFHAACSPVTGNIVKPQP